jgi:hypothetical protein
MIGTTVMVSGHYPPNMDSANAQINPAQVISPAQSCVPSNASGIMVSASIESMAPAASAVVSSSQTTARAN